MNNGDKLIKEGFEEFELPPDSEPVATNSRHVSSGGNLQISAIEIRPGHVETFKVIIGDGHVIVDAEALNDFRWFNRACIAQLRRSFPPTEPKAWNAIVDRALRVAKEPVPLAEEMARRHGTADWKDEPKAWLVRERVPETGAGLLSGQYSTFKSFVLLDLAGSVMTGLPFLEGRTVRRGGVLLFAAEGASDVPIRTRALIDHRLAREKEFDHADLFRRSKISLERLPLSYVSRCRPLLDPRTVDWMVAKAHEEQNYFQKEFGLDLVLIGIDTMSAAAGWESENEAAQAQIVMNHLADISTATKAFVLAVDHFGKNLSSGTRGSVVKEASADIMFALLGEKDEETNVVSDTRLVIRKQRSGPQGETYPFEAKLVDMGLDHEGEPLTSRVIDWNVERVVSEKPEKPSKAQFSIQEGLAKVFETNPEKIEINGTSEIQAVREDVLRLVFMEMYQRDATEKKSAGALRQAWSKALDKLDVDPNYTRGIVDGVKYVWHTPGPM
jgi:hypothetical protein